MTNTRSHCGKRRKVLVIVLKEIGVIASTLQCSHMPHTRAICRKGDDCRLRPRTPFCTGVANLEDSDLDATYCCSGPSRGSRETLYGLSVASALRLETPHKIPPTSCTVNSSIALRKKGVEDESCDVTPDRVNHSQPEPITPCCSTINVSFTLVALEDGCLNEAKLLLLALSDRWPFAKQLQTG